MRSKRYAGHLVRQLRLKHQLTLQASAARMGLSAAYLSQIESNQRPLSDRVVIALRRAFGAGASEFDTDEPTRLLADLREASADLGLEGTRASLAELKFAAQRTPTLARQFLALHRAYRGLDERLKVLDETLAIHGADGAETPTPYQEVRDLFHYRDNYIDELDIAAEALAEDIGIVADTNVSATLERALAERYGVRAELAPEEQSSLLRRFDPAARVVWLAQALPPPTRHFQLAVQLAEIAFGGLIDDLLHRSLLKSGAATDVAGVALANYAAGALLMPYRHFADSAMRLRHDIEQLQRRYGTSFEQVCHRLSNLQRPGAHGIPFYFVRVDQAGNITKRHSTTRFHFARFGGACPLWNVHEALGHPGHILVQVAEMPDGIRYLCLGRSIVKRSGTYARPNRLFAIGIGCEISYASQLIYADGLALDGSAVPIGVSCRICERPNCHQRAFPPLDRGILVPRNERHIIPYVLE